MAALLLCAGPAAAATRYVAPAGKTTGDGLSAGAPWSLGKALTSSVSGDTVLMAGGTYPATTAAAGTRTGMVTFRPQGTAVPRMGALTLTAVDGLRFEDVTFAGRLVALDRARSWQFVRTTWSQPAGLAFTNFASSSDSLAKRGVLEGVRFEDSAFVAAPGAKPTDALALLNARAVHRDVVVENTLFRGLGGNGMKFHRVDGLRVVGNAFDRVMNTNGSATHSAAVQVVGPSNDILVARNFVNGGRGVIVQPDLTTGTGATTRMVVESNVFSGRQFGGRFVATPGLRLVGNTFWSTSGDATSSLDIYRHGSAAGSRRAGESTEGVVMQNNLIRRIDVVNNYARVGFASQAANLIKVDDRDRPAAAGTIVGVSPAFRAFTGTATASDMHLASKQPAGVIDGGVAASGLDCDGQPRGAKPDLGALEASPVSPGTGCQWHRRHPGR